MGNREVSWTEWMAITAVGKVGVELVHLLRGLLAEGRLMYPGCKGRCEEGQVRAPLN